MLQLWEQPYAYNYKQPPYPTSCPFHPLILLFSDQLVLRQQHQQQEINYTSKSSNNRYPKYISVTYIYVINLE